jgi:DNA primase
MNEIEEIKQRLDIVELIGQYVALKKAGTNYKGVCPFHQEKTPSMMVSPQKQIWKCFGCNRGGSVFDFVMEAEHLEFGDALRLLAQKAGITLQARTQAEHQTQSRKERLYRINSLVARIYQKLLLESPVGRAALDYLKGRGLTDETIKKFGLGVAPRSFDLKRILATKYSVTGAELSQVGSPERFFNRIIFPIYDVLGHVVGFTGRVLDKSEPKYLNSPETPLFNKSRTIFGLNFAKGAIKDKDYVVLVEGQMDVIALHQAGVLQAVASSGTAVTEAQLQLLSKYTPNFLLAFDNDPAGRMATKKVIEMMLKLDLNGKVIEFGDYKDAGELFEKDSNHWAPLAKEAPEGLEWWIKEEIGAAGDIKFIENKKKVIKAMLPVLMLVSEPTRLDHHAQRLALAVGVRSEAIYAALSKLPGPAAKDKETTGGQLRELALTNEEQLLAVGLARPDLLVAYAEKFENISWQSEDASRIAEQIKKRYNNKTLAKNQAQFLSEVKTNLDSRASEKIDSWQFWLSNQWGEISDEIARDLLTESLATLATKDYEQRKTELALQIRRAQDVGDLPKVKELMKELSELAKERG